MDKVFLFVKITNIKVINWILGNYELGLKHGKGKLVTSD